MTALDVDVVILNYCTPELSIRAAWSARTAGAGSILVVDNGSPDQSLPLLEKGVSDFGRVLALPVNIGFSAGNNQGAAAGNLPLLLLLNSDVVLHADALPALIEALNHKAVGIVAPALYDQHGEPQASAYRFITPGTLLCSLFGLDKLAAKLGWRAFQGNVDARRNANYMGRAESLYGPCLLLRREAFEQVGGFDEDFFLYCEETDLILRLAKAGWSAYRTAAATVTHDHNQSAGQAPKRSLILMSESHRLYARKHFNRAGRIATACAFVLGLALRWAVAKRKDDREKYAAALGVWFHRTPSADPRTRARGRRSVEARGTFSP